MAHLWHMNGTEIEVDWNWLPVSNMEHIPQVFDTSFPKGTSQLPYPFPGCPGSSRTWNGLRNHFRLQYWGDRLWILEENPNPLTKYESCGSQVPPWRLSNQHYESDKWRIWEERQRWRDTLQILLKLARWISAWTGIPWILPRPFCSWSVQFHSTTPTFSPCNSVLILSLLVLSSPAWPYWRKFGVNRLF